MFEDLIPNLRLRNAFRLPSIGSPEMMGNDLPEQGGIMGNMATGPVPPMNPFETPSVAPIPQAPGSMNTSAMDRMRELYKPSNDAADRFERLMNVFPQREKASFLRKLGAGLVSYRQGHEAGQSFLDKPFTDKLEDWKAKAGPASQMATQERQSNAEQRQFAYQTVATQLKEEAQQEREKNNEINAKIRQQRADAYDFKARNPNLRLIMTKGGNVMAFNPATGETRDTGIPTGSLTEADKINLEHEVRTAENVQKGEIESGHIGERGAQSRLNIAASGAEARSTKATVGGGTNKPGATDRGLLPTQVRVQRENNVREFVMRNPALGKFVKVVNGEIKVTPPGVSRFTGSKTGPTPEEYKKITESVLGVSPTSATRTGNTPPITPPLSVPAGPAGSQSGVAPKYQRNSKGEVRVSHDGGKTWQMVK